jgi:hypothetical protein
VVVPAGAGVAAGGALVPAGVGVGVLGDVVVGTEADGAGVVVLAAGVVGVPDVVVEPTAACPAPIAGVAVAEVVAGAAAAVAPVIAATVPFAGAATQRPASSTQTALRAAARMYADSPA